jgi:hypothetical protein
LERPNAEGPSNGHNWRKSVGRPVVIGLGTLIILLLVVAWLF